MLRHAGPRILEVEIIRQSKGWFVVLVEVVEIVIVEPKQDQVVVAVVVVAFVLPIHTIQETVLHLDLGEVVVHLGDQRNSGRNVLT